MVCGLPGLLCGLCLFKFPESPKYMLSIGNKEYTLKSLQKMYSVNTGRSPEDYEVWYSFPEYFPEYGI